MSTSPSPVASTTMRAELRRNEEATIRRFWSGQSSWNLWNLCDLFLPVHRYYAEK